MADADGITKIDRAGHSSYNRRKTSYDDNNDFYITPTWATEALIGVYPDIVDKRTHTRVWEPCAGAGHMAVALEKHIGVLATELITRTPLIGMQTQIRNGINFLNIADPVGVRPTAICMNPPYGMADAFILKALSVVDQETHDVAAILPLTRLGGSGRYNDMWSVRPPHSIFVFSERVSMFSNANAAMATNEGTVTYAWFVWRARPKEQKPTHPVIRFIPPGTKPSKRIRNASLVKVLI